VGPTFHLEEDHKPGDLPRFFFLQNEFDGLDDMITYSCPCDIMGLMASECGGSTRLHSINREGAEPTWLHG